MPRPTPASLLVAAAAIAAFFPLADCLAQPRGMNVRTGIVRPGMDDEDMSMGMEAMYGGYPRPGADADAPKPKTDLGKKIITQDYTRSPQTVLAARVKL